jgi:hypothetical protein
MLDEEYRAHDFAASAQLLEQMQRDGAPRSAALTRIDPTVIADFRRHPRFADSLRASAKLAIELYRGNRLVNLISSDRGRLMLSRAALYLHHTRDPDASASALTAARLQSIFVETGLGSAGRAKALIALMRWGGYLEAAPPQRDRRVKALQPTQKLLALHRARWRGTLAAAGLVLPDAAEGAARFDEPGFVRAFSIALGAGFLGGLRLIDYAPDLQIVVDRSAGLLVVLSIILAARPEDGMPPTTSIPVSASGLAQQFHVSRSQIRKFLREVEERGLIERSGELEMRIRFLPRMIESIETALAAMLVNQSTCARYALDEINVNCR